MPDGMIRSGIAHEKLTKKTSRAVEHYGAKRQTLLMQRKRMQFENVRIESVEYVLGPHRITSADLEEQISDTLMRLKIRPGMLEGMSGIQERRFWELGTMPSDVATLAARKAIETSGIDPHQIGCLVSTSVMKDYIEPSVASLVHGNLKLAPHCVNYDIGNACLGFVSGILHIGMMIEAKMISHGLVVAGEAGRTLLESTVQHLQRSDVSKAELMEHVATLTLGEGAVAMILSHKDVAQTGHKIQGAVSLAATEHSRLCVASPDLMHADVGKLLVAGVRLVAKTWEIATETLERWSDQEIDMYMPHQVSSHNTAEVVRTLGLTASKFKLIFPFLGNTGPAGLPIALAMAEQEGQLKDGDHICLMGVASGLNSTLVSVEW